jgi:transcriptional regulator GlxA family with amidase domain
MGALAVGQPDRVAVSLRVPRPSAPRGHLLAREAEAWLRENLTEPVTIRDLCAALHTSERTLHAAFREHVGTTPKAFVKAQRLQGARRDLLHPGPHTRVTDVALRWCFLHFGWFAHDYQALFGETPSRTLRRAFRRPALLNVSPMLRPQAHLLEPSLDRGQPLGLVRGHGLEVLVAVDDARA